MSADAPAVRRLLRHVAAAVASPAPAAPPGPPAAAPWSARGAPATAGGRSPPPPPAAAAAVAVSSPALLSFTQQSLAMSCYGLQGMTADASEVRVLSRPLSRPLSILYLAPICADAREVPVFRWGACEGLVGVCFVRPVCGIDPCVCVTHDNHLTIAITITIITITNRCERWSICLRSLRGSCRGLSLAAPSPTRSSASKA